MDRFTIKEAAKYLGVSEEKVYYWAKIKRLKICPTTKYKTILINKSELDDFKFSNSKELSFLVNGVPDGYYTADMLADKFDVQRDTINLWIRQNRFKDVKKSGVPLGSPGYYLIPEKSVLKYEKQVENIKNNYLMLKEVIEFLDISEHTFYQWRKKGYFSAPTIEWHDSLVFSKSYVITFKNKLVEEKQMLSIGHLSKQLGISKEKVLDLMKDEYLQKSIKSEDLLLSKENLERFLEQHDWSHPNNQIEKTPIPKGYFNTRTLADYFKEEPIEISRWIRQGRFTGVKKIGPSSGPTTTFLIPESSVREYEKFINDLNQNYIKVEEAKDILGVSRSTIGNWINNKKISRGIKWLKTWYLDITEIEEIREELLSQKEEDISLEFSSKEEKKEKKRKEK
ncbi:Helix-turn-helix domain protein [Paraliobacillus sp. PM-2]|uniref:helix-turn-helix domain-containing protein n=1 Tax=Paraliobacillus sp. PM-2 TaxID=1462524 RepID=UPI00061CC777|nr:helix-turn-helix domain-containing protein [Paraliobacillus sp. PM-2]CQR46441.1 Helix-turn-helix domain protein [Paraliobacillus sp. PM-2]